MWILKYLRPYSHDSPVAWRKGMKDIPVDAWNTDESSWGNLPTWSTVTIPPNTDITLMETGMNHNSQLPELRAVCFVPTHAAWLLPLCLTVGLF